MWIFFSGAGPDRRTAAGLNFRIGAAETPAECRCDQRPPCTPGDGAQDARILEVVAARSRGSHQMHPSLYAIAPMTRPITHNNALRLSLSPITRATRSLTPPSLAAATRRLVVPNALLVTVPKGTRRQGGSGRRSARLAMLLRSCGGLGGCKRPGGWEEEHARAQNTAGQGPCAVSNSKKSQQTGPCATPVGAEVRAGIHTDRDSRGEGGGRGIPRQRLSLRPVVGVASSTAAASNPLWAWPCLARRRCSRDGY